MVCVEVEDCELAQRAELDRNGAGEVVGLELGERKFVSKRVVMAYCSLSGGHRARTCSHCRWERLPRQRGIGPVRWLS